MDQEIRLELLGLPHQLGARAVTVGIEMFDHLDLGVCLTDARATILYVNERTREMYGLPPRSDLIGRSLRAHAPSEFFLERAALVERVISTGRCAVVREIVAGRQFVSHFLLTVSGDQGVDRLCLGFHVACPRVLRNAPDPMDEFCECSLHDWGHLGTLTKREMEVLVMICEGKTAADIAADLHRTEETVKSHKASLLRKLGCENSVQLAKIGWLAGITRRDLESFSRS